MEALAETMLHTRAGPRPDKAPLHKVTCEEYMLMPLEEPRYELIDGRLHVVPAPNLNHQDIVGQLYLALVNFVRARDLGRVFVAPCDVVLSRFDVLQPDLLFVSRERADILTEANVQGPPDLVIEVLSPATAEKDRVGKRRVYERFGVPEYWLVDPETRTVEVLRWTEDGYETAGVYGEGDTLRSPLLPELAVELAGVFAVE